MPRKGVRKRLTKRKSQPSPPSTSKPAPRPAVRRKQWTNQQMTAAIKAVEEGSGINKAAGDHGVPASTLKDRVSGRVKHGDKPGPKPYLSSKEECELGSFLKSCATVGYGKTRRDVLHIAESVAREKGLLKKECITHGWWNRFIERQGDLSLRRSDSTAHVRMNAINKETMKQYFSLLKDVLDEHDLQSKPAQIYNVDESGMPFDYKAPNIVAKTGSKKIRYRQSGKKGQVTVVACASAVGQAIPPMIIFDAQNLNHAWTKDEVPGTRYGLSDKGWINTDLFEGWLVEHFIQYAIPGRPLLLLLDGHSTHYQPDVIRFAREHDIIMLCLPPHTTHESQPLDCGVFKPLKSKWTEVCHRYFQKHPGKVITRFNFNMLFSQAWLKSLIPSNIIAGFKTCGVFPYNPSAILTLSADDGEIGRAQSDDDRNEDEKGSGDEGQSDDENRSDREEEEGGDVGEPNASEDGHDGGEVHELSGKEGHELSSENELPQESSLLDTESGVGSFTATQVDLFQRRFEEGYNLFTDPCYVNWLKIHHPEALPTDRTDDICVSSVAGHFASVSPLCPVNDVTSPPEVTPGATAPGPTPGPGSEASNRTVSSSGGSVVSKYLAVPVESTPSRTDNRLPRAKLLTSLDSLRILEKKEKKKQEELEMKEKRKKEREEKKKQKEEEEKKKAEKKAMREQERIRKAEQKEEEKKKKEEEKKKKEEEKKKEEAKRKRDETRKCSTEVKRKRRCTKGQLKETEAAPVIDTNVCCTCNGLYEQDVIEETGADWLACACGRWLHEDCVDDCVKDDEGKDRICPHCLDDLATKFV